MKKTRFLKWQLAKLNLFFYWVDSVIPVLFNRYHCCGGKNSMTLNILVKDSLSTTLRAKWNTTKRIASN